MLQLEIVTPVKLVRSAQVHMVVVPGLNGDFGVLAGHAPLLSAIRPGAISVYADPATSAPERIFITGGLAQVTEEGLTILAESATPVAEMDAQQVAADLAAARASGDAEAIAEASAAEAVLAG